MHYLAEKMMMIIGYGDWEERGQECEIWKEKRENYDKWMLYERTIVWVQWFGVWVSIYIKIIVNWFSTFRTSLCMGSEWIFISLLFVPYLCFEIEKNSNSYSNLVKVEKTRQIGFDSNRYPQVLLPCLIIFVTRDLNKSKFFFNIVNIKMKIP